MDDVTRLESIAQQLIARVRDDEPDANARWLAAVTTPSERDALLYVLAAAVPAERRWWDLTEWTRTPEEIQLRQAMRRQALLNSTARANVRRVA